MKTQRQMISALLTGSLALSIMMQHAQAKAANLMDTRAIKVQAVQKAERSTDLQVHDDFNFATSQQVMLDVTVTNDLKQPEAGVLLKVYALEDPKAIKGIKRALKSTLLTVLRTDDNGNVQRLVEIPAHYRDIRVEKLTLSQNNVQNVTFKGQERISLSF